MKNRKKLTDDQLDAVSGGDTTRENAENSKMVEQDICPLCGHELKTTVDGFLMKTCYPCYVTWTNYHGYWEREDYNFSSGC